MSVFTLTNKSARIRYELSEREIYNDIRSEIGSVSAVTVVDVDPVYSWRAFYQSFYVPPNAKRYIRPFFSTVEMLDHEIGANSAKTYINGQWESYYDYSIEFDIRSTTTVWVRVINTGSTYMLISFWWRYKYLSVEKITHDEFISELITVRATDETSIGKYGRRVMNLTWTEGTNETVMQSLVDHYLLRYKEPVARVKALVKGTTDVLRTQIYTREFSDLLTVVCDELGLNADFYLDTISLRDSLVGIPECTWGLEQIRSYEESTLFVLDTSELDGPHILGS